MGTSRKDRDHFNQGVGMEKADSKGAFSHGVGKVNKAVPDKLENVAWDDLPQKYKNTWYLKRIGEVPKKGKVADKEEMQENLNDAAREVVAQEFFRLLIPGHPKTRLVVDDDGVAFVASKQIEGFRALPVEVYWGDDPEEEKKFDREKDHFNECLAYGLYIGLGEVMTVSLLMNEIDLKNGNMALDKNNRIIKFDGDWCFAGLLGRIAPRDISARDLEMLPFLSGYSPHNWMGAVIQGERFPFPFLEHDLTFNPRFRAEVNDALLRMLLLPDELIHHFVENYVADAGQQNIIINELMERKNQMYEAALQNHDFVAYMKSDAASGQCDEYIDYLDTFKTTGKHPVSEMITDLPGAFHGRLESLRSAVLVASERVEMTVDDKVMKGPTTNLILSSLGIDKSVHEVDEFKSDDMLMSNLKKETDKMAHSSVRHVVPADNEKIPQSSVKKIVEETEERIRQQRR